MVGKMHDSQHELLVPAPADFHTHLRQGDMMHLVAPHVSLGGMTLAYVMPNTNPPITTTKQALEYYAMLQPLTPGVHIMMTLYLSPDLTVDEVRRAKACGVVAGIKSYPRGVTTGSQFGVESYDRYFEVFAEMEKQNLVLNLHGEVPSNPHADISVMNAESAFLDQLKLLHRFFPRLKIVLEHATTKEAIEVVKSLGETVACTITAHHLALTIDDVVGQPLHFCKPVAKEFSDRRALREIVASGHPRFFLGSDSAPHNISKKMPSVARSSDPVPPCAAGIYTSPHLLPLIATLFEADGLEPQIPLERLAGFVGGHGRKWYGVPAGGAVVKLRRRRSDSDFAQDSIYQYNGEEVVAFSGGVALRWEISRKMQ